MSRGKKVLFLGGSGLLSGCTLSAFIEKEFDISVLSRGNRRLPEAKNLFFLKADRKDFSSLSSVLENKKFDFTVDFLAYDDIDIKNLFSVKGFQTSRYCMISSGQVYLVTQDQKPPFKEEDYSHPIICEPLPGTYDWHNWVYGMGKRRAEAELEVQSSVKGFESLALRLPVVQGEKDGENSKRLWAWLERMKDGVPVILPDGGENQLRFIYAQDAALFLLELALSPFWPEEKALNLAQNKEMSLKNFLALAAACGGFKPEFVEVKFEKLSQAGIEDFCYPYWGKWCSRPDPFKAISLYRFRPREPEEYLPSVVRAHIENPPQLSHSGYSFRKKELEVLRSLSL
ncbi:MAG: hypothetical protein Fur0012_07620 [Elusimicrobiota bacterium]